MRAFFIIIFSAMALSLVPASVFAQAPQVVSTVPVSFTQNNGQFGAKTLFKAEAGGGVFYFCRDEIASVLLRSTDEPLDLNIQDDAQGFNNLGKTLYKCEGLLIKTRFIDSNNETEIIGVDRLSHDNNYFYGNDPAKWVTDVPSFTSIVYKDIYAGIDLRYYGRGQTLKYDFIIHPGADLSRIRIKYEDVNDIGLLGNGNLSISTDFGDIFERAPHFYQNVDGMEKEISGMYKLYGNNEFGFAADGRYDESRDLVIDPELIYSTFLGGSMADAVQNVVLDAQGNIYVVGNTWSPDLPTAVPYDSTYNGELDIFAMKINPDGSDIIYSTYIGADSHDVVCCNVLKSTGSVVFSGNSNSADYPVINAFDDTHNGEYDAIATIIGPAGNTLEYSSYFGGADRDGAPSVCLDDMENIYLVGSTRSPDFPTVNALFSTYNGGWKDAFLIKLAGGDNSVLYMTFFGGSEEDQATDIDVDSYGNPHFTGCSNSPDLPLVNPYSQYTGIGNYTFGHDDVIVAVFSAAGDSLMFSTYLGGEGNRTDVGYAITLDSDNNIYFAGGTSTIEGFPLVNPYDATFQGGQTSSYADIFISKFSPMGGSLLFSTYLGGNSSDRVFEIIADDYGNAYLAGGTRSENFPLVNPCDSSLSYLWDGFVAAISTVDRCLFFSTFLGGGSGSDQIIDIAFDNQDQIYAVGVTESGSFPLINALDSTRNSQEGFLSVFDINGAVVYPTSITGTVTDEFSSPVEGVTVSLVGHDIQQITDQNGIYDFPGICPGRYEMTFSGWPFPDTTFDNVYVYNDGNPTVLDVMFYYPPPGDNCYNPLIIPPDSIPPFSIIGDNSAGFHNFYLIEDTSGVCWQGRWGTGVTGNRPDIVYKWVAPETREYIFSLCNGNTEFWADIFLWNYTCPEEPLFPDDFICGSDWGVGCSEGQGRLLNIPLEQGQEVLIIVDGFPWEDVWNYELEISRMLEYSGTVTDSALNPLGNVLVRADQAEVWDLTDSSGHYKLYLPPRFYDFSYDCPRYYEVTLQDVDVTFGDTIVDVEMSMAPEQISVWYGNPDGSPITAAIGERVSVNVYIQNMDSINIGGLHIPLGSNNLYFDGWFSQTEGQFYFPLSEWQYKGFVLFEDSPPNPSGWTTEGFYSFYEYGTSVPRLFLDTPTRVAKFVLNAVYDPTLVGDTIQCLDYGWWYLWDREIEHGMEAYDSVGINQIYSIYEYFSPVYFVDELPPGECDYIVGDVNGSDSYNGLDITYGVNFFKGGPDPAYECECTAGNIWYVSGDVNASCSYNGLDITYGVAYFKGGPDPIPCGDCPPQ
ncbi:MAG: carboxypeptidase regulatory-like domain-containing protein [Candidatus Zixiibacteriota bacterium]|nr:MAG: carboxypeptidase regulatory-like domain-containing protein [candidate division Zixibacteria bacterium]